ncbi:AraC family transcriptional regulator [Paenibacillus pasadenensis]|uniref:Transcriptional regulator, AraC family n=1 Tax=Paenibacillus pasadenensis TaxID=217090 RepID=A0A2N5N290_9BACL|nr:MULTISPECIES: AraC family transcriptional regulator [Paenibacillus]PLT44442.1 Transcriptional regulator, AraC family [Paenibacillus pasadenensis]QGG54922.1 helix-turn-helix domain-containing protein [Paenibacillus sp. B01]
MPVTKREDHQEKLEIAFFTPSGYELASPAWPIRIGRNRTKEGYRIGPRTTPFHYLIAVAEGEGEFLQGGGRYRLGPGDLFALFPETIHEYYASPDNRLQQLILAFDGPEAAALLERGGLTPERPHRSGLSAGELMRCLDRFLEEADGEPSDLARLARFHEAMALLAEASPGAGRRPAEEGWLRQARDYIDLHYAGGITVSGAADHVGIDRTHFSKRFREAYGVTPIRYIQGLKLAEAERLLGHTSLTLSEIAYSVGYPDLFSFSKAFKKHKGRSPSECRSKAAGPD